MERGASEMEVPAACGLPIALRHFRTQHATLHIFKLLQLTVNDRYVFRTFIRKSLLFPAFQFSVRRIGN